MCVCVGGLLHPPLPHPHPISQLISVEIQQSRHCIGLLVLSTPWWRGVHCKKKVIDFHVLSEDVTNQTLSGRESLASDIPAGDGKIIHLFYSVFCYYSYADFTLFTETDGCRAWGGGGAPID